MATDTKGQAAEATAEAFLQSQGLRSICRNFRCKLGEIDLIMQDQQTLVFVEVRLRSNQRFAAAAESITWKKQQKILRAAQVYLQQNRMTDTCPCRFDAVCLSHHQAQPEWIKNAFGY
jgi:putative endonuclease